MRQYIEHMGRSLTQLENLCILALNALEVSSYDSLKSDMAKTQKSISRKLGYLGNINPIFPSNGDTRGYDGVLCPCSMKFLCKAKISRRNTSPTLTNSTIESMNWMNGLGRGRFKPRQD